MREVFCEYCYEFRPVRETDRTLECAKCNSLIYRRNGAGLTWCHDCHDYRPADERINPVPESDGYDYADIVCRRCAAIMATIRASSPVPASLPGPRS